MRLPADTRTVNPTSEVGAVRRKTTSPVFAAANQIAAALDNSADRAYAVSVRAQEQEQKRANVAAGVTAAEIRADWTARLAKSQAEAPEDPSGFTERTLKDFDDDTKTRIENAPENQRESLQNSLSILRADVMGRSTSWEAIRQIEAQKAGLSRIIDTQANVVRTDSTQWTSAMADVEKAVNGSSLADKEAALRAARGSMAKSMLQGLNERDTAGAAKLLSSGQFDDVLSPADKNALVNDNQTEQRRREAEAKAAAAEARRQAEHRQLMLRVGMSDQLKDEQAARAEGKTTGLRNEDIRTAYADQPGQADRVIKHLGLLDDTVAVRKEIRAAPLGRDSEILARFAPDVAADGGGKTLPDKGVVERGNINLGNRPVVSNPDGSVSTVRSMSFEENGKEVLIPTVSDDGRILSDEDAIALYRKTGRHLGKFADVASADAYAQALHDEQAQRYAGPGYAARKEIHDLLSRDLAQKHDAFSKDPAAASLIYFPELQAMRRDAFADTAKMPGYMAQSLAVQARMGVPENRRVPLSRTDAAAIVEQFGAASTPADKLNILLPVTSGLPDEAVARRAVAALTEAKLPAAAIYALDVARDPARRDDARRLLAELSVPPTNITLKDADVKTAKASAAATYKDGVGSVMLKSYELTGNPAYRNRFAADQGAVEHLTKLRMGASPDASGTAYRDLFGHMGVVDDDSLAHVTFDKDKAAEQSVRDGLTFLRSQAAAGLSGEADTLLAAELASMKDRPEGERAAHEKLRRRQFTAQARDLARTGIWINQGDGFALVVPGTQAVLAKTYSLDEVMAAASSPQVRAAQDWRYVP